MADHSVGPSGGMIPENAKEVVAVTGLAGNFCGFLVCLVGKVSNQSRHLIRRGYVEHSV